MIELSGGSRSVAEAYKGYQAAWTAFLKAYKLQSLEHFAKPTTFSWKVADKAELYKNLVATANITEQVHIGTVNGRFIASSVLTTPIENDLYILKILERRFGSSDPLGLDSLDFLCRDSSAVMKMLKSAGANAVPEHNDMHSWISLRFGDKNQYEAKFTDHLVLSVAIKEMHQAEEKLVSQVLT
jgi:hypothetical protein